jgi:lysophospholipase L1-like esterase
LRPALLVLTKLLLLPLLLRQGGQVRARALRLPEAEGPREGVAGSGKVCLRVLIVGDSAAAGVGARHQIQALAGRLSEALAQRMNGAVVWQLIARTGDTTSQSLRALRTQSLHPADVMVTALGLNDVVAQVPTRVWLSRLEKLNRAAARRAGVQHVVHSGIPPIQAFPLLPNPLRWVLAKDAQRYNQALAEWVKQEPGRSWLPLPMEDEQARSDTGSSSVLMAEDGFHPSPALYALWAEQLAAVICGQIAPQLPETLPSGRRGR